MVALSPVPMCPCLDSPGSPFKISFIALRSSSVARSFIHSRPHLMGKARFCRFFWLLHQLNSPAITSLKCRYGKALSVHANFVSVLLAMSPVVLPVTKEDS